MQLAYVVLRKDNRALPQVSQYVLNSPTRCAARDRVLEKSLELNKKNAALN